ncbi:hypothetical protein [Nocardioides conyzicola]|uniref:Uncharacterized protein n=1 Tax=Nocardioides conyzicola TaxID=1651781 RepID=A0ABP8WLD9_9ACTN
MKNLLRAAVAATTALVAVAATTVPAHASYRLVSDPAGDQKPTGRCTNAPGAMALDVRKMSTTIYQDRDGGAWRMRATLRVARLPKPKDNQYQTFDWFAYRGGDAVFTVHAERWTKGGKVKLAAWAADGGNPSTPGGPDLKVKTRGKTIIVWGLRLKPGKTWRFRGEATFDQWGRVGVSCSVQDVTRKSASVGTTP